MNINAAHSTLAFRGNFNDRVDFWKMSGKKVNLDTDMQEVITDAGKEKTMDPKATYLVINAIRNIKEQNWISDPEQDDQISTITIPQGEPELILQNIKTESKHNSIPSSGGDYITITADKVDLAG